MGSCKMFGPDCHTGFNPPGAKTVSNANSIIYAQRTCYTCTIRTITILQFCTLRLYQPRQHFHSLQVRLRIMDDCHENSPRITRITRRKKHSFDRRGLIHQTLYTNCRGIGLDKSSPYNRPCTMFYVPFSSSPGVARNMDDCPRFTVSPFHTP